MRMERDRTLDDAGDWRVTLALTSRTTAAHSLMSALGDDDKRVIGAAMTRALDEIAAVLSERRMSEANS